jgi:hypothetical protein
MNFNQIKFGKPSIYVDGIGGIDPEAQAVYDRIIADGGVSNLTRLNYFVVGLKGIYGSLANVPVCYDAHWIGYKLGSGTGATAGQAAAKLYSLTVAGDAVQTTAASQPLLLAHNGVDNYWWGSGVSGNYVSTPNATANSNTGNKEIIAKVDYTVTGAGGQAIYNKYKISTNQGISLYYNPAGTIQFFLTTDLTGIANYASSSIGTNFVGYIKVTVSFSAGTCTYAFLSSVDGITYTSRGGGSIAGNTLAGMDSNVEVGAWSGTFTPTLGKIYRLTISNSIGGAPVVDFNPATYNAATSQTAWTSATGEVWTINTGTATSGYKGVLVDRTIVQGDGVDDNMLSGTVSISSATNFLAVNPLNLNSAKYFIGSSIADVNILYYQPSAVRYGNTTPYLELSFTAVVQNRLALFTAVKNGATSLLEYNNANQVTGSVGLATITTVKLFSPNGTTLLGNINLNSLVISGLSDNLTTRTATYNLIRSLNNNAF